jgi:hypothetical protein
MTGIAARIKKRWAIIGGAITGIGALFSVLDILPKLVSSYENAWTLNFIPDVLLVMGLTLLAAVAYAQFGRELAASYADILGGGTRWQRASLVLLSLAMLGLVATSLGDWKKYYRQRVSSAKFDWSYVQARSALKRGDFVRAAAFFKSDHGKQKFLSTALKKKRDREEEDTLQRLADVDKYLKRYSQAATRVPISLPDLLLVQRAARLYPDSPDVLSATADAQQRLRAAMEPWFAGIGALQHGDTSLARLSFHESLEKGGISLFDQELLLRYCGQQDLRYFSSAEVEVLDGYLKIPVQRLRFLLRDAHPWIQALLALPSAPSAGDGPAQLSYYDQMLQRDHRAVPHAFAHQ